MVNIGSLAAFRSLGGRQRPSNVREAFKGSTRHAGRDLPGSTNAPVTVIARAHSSMRQPCLFARSRVIHIRLQNHCNVASVYQ